MESRRHAVRDLCSRVIGASVVVASPSQQAVGTRREMTPVMHVESLDHASLAVATRIHAIQRAAYAQEAALIEAVSFPPLNGTVDAVRSSTDRYLGVRVGDELVGVAGIAPDPEGGFCIASFVVAPAWQRRGIGRALLQHVLEHHAGHALHLETAARNLPALALYRRAGFVEARRRVVGVEALELVRLQRLPVLAPSSTP